MTLYSVWGPNIDDADTVVEGSEQPKFANGEVDKSVPWLHYTLHAASFEKAVEQFHRKEGHI